MVVQQGLSAAPKKASSVAGYERRPVFLHFGPRHTFARQEAKGEI